MRCAARPTRGSPCPTQRSARQVFRCQISGVPSLECQGSNKNPSKHVQKLLDGARSAAVGAALAAALVLGGTGPATAADFVKTGTCLLSKCQAELASCLTDPTCSKSLLCLNACNNRPDEAACDIRCGDLYAGPVIDSFNTCALSREKCVASFPDTGEFPVPCDDALSKSFDLNSFTGRWYVTAGLNPLFDQFDCQEHFFDVPSEGNLTGQINWRVVNEKGDDWIQKSTVQEFVQDKSKPSVMYNHDNDYLHYEDDWYVIASRPDKYVLVYYIGNNDAWKGYGGAVLYSRSATLPEEYVPELRDAVAAVGKRWEDFKVTDNTCGPHPKTQALPWIKSGTAQAQQQPAVRADVAALVPVPSSMS